MLRGARRGPGRLCAAAALALAAAGCIGTAQPPLPPPIAEGLAAHSMRHLETRSLHLYYPAFRKELALRTARRLERCVGALRRRALLHNDFADRKLVVLMPEAAINNAFVFPPLLSQGPFSVVPTYETVNSMLELGLPLDPSFVSCHESVHYVQMLQVAGAWRWVGAVFGDVLTPQAGLDVWFHEGVATYYETELQPGLGRMAWPVWHGMFHAAYAGGGLDGGDISLFHRPFHWGNHYLVGSHFVEFLVERYGEERLWRVIARQGRSLFFPFLVSLRFRSVYGKSLTGLLDEFSTAVERRFPPRSRPPAQRSVRDAGTDARYAAGADGTEAIVSSSGDEPARLRVYGPEGGLLRERNLTEVVPPRELAVASPQLTSGLSLTADGSAVYFAAVDLGESQQQSRLVRYDVAADELTVVEPDLGGPGGAISPDGRTYYFSFADGDRHHLAALDLESGERRFVVAAAARTYYASPRPSPDGSRLVASVFDGRDFFLEVFDAGSGDRIARVSPEGGPAHDGWLAGRDRLVYLAAHEGRFQVHLRDLESGATRRLSDAPYLALAPRPRGEAVRFLNREGWRWTVDEVPVPSALPAATPPDGAAAPSRAARGPGGRPPAGELEIVTDEPYSSFDGLLVPNLHALALVNPSEGATLVGLSLSGSDRLQFHRWAITGLYQPASEELSGRFEYVNRQLAPYTIALAAEQLTWEDLPPSSPGDLPAAERRQRRASLTVGRTFRTTTIALGAEGVEDLEGLPPDFDPTERRLAGPTLSIDYTGAEATPYAGVRRALELSLSGAYFDEALSSLDERFADARTALRLTSPLPLSDRHTLRLSLRARALVGTRERFLQVGGAGALAPLYQSSDQPVRPFDAPALPPQIEFFEPLRGYEDHPLAVDQIGIAGVTYRYPIIVDYGFTSTFWLLPSFFLRQIDVELFGAGAADRAREDAAHLAAGGALSLGFALGLAPLDLRYQLARRFTDDEALVHSLFLSLGATARSLD